MAATTVTVKREIAAPPERVWAVITDLDHAAEVLSGVSTIERLEGEGYAVGVKWRETRRMMGKQATEEMWVSEVDEPRSTTVSAHSSGTRYSTVFRLEPVGESTVVHIEFSGETVNPSVGQKLAWALFGAMGMKASRKALAQDLEDIAKAAESA